MVRNYKRVAEKSKMVEGGYGRSIQCIQNGESIRSVSRKKGINFTALQERVKGGKAKPPRLRRKSIFTREQELEIADHVKKLTDMFYVLTPIDLRRSAFEFAERNNINHTFSK
jgi:hypothetical protein